MLKLFNVLTLLYHFHEELVRCCIQIFPLCLCSQVLFVCQPTVEFTVEIMRIAHKVNSRLQHCETRNTITMNIINQIYHKCYGKTDSNLMVQIPHMLCSNIASINYNQQP